LQSPWSRRSVAPHRLCAPPPPRCSPALPRGVNRPTWRRGARPRRRLTPAPVRPEGAPSLPSGQSGRPLRGDRPAPPAKGTFPLPGPDRHRFAQTAGPRVFPRTVPRPSDAPPVCANMNFELRADGRHALRGDCLGPPVFSFLFSRIKLQTPVWRCSGSPEGSSRFMLEAEDAPGSCRGSFTARTRSDRASLGRTGSGPGMRCARQPPVTSFVGDRRPRASFFLVGATPA